MGPPVRAVEVATAVGTVAAGVLAVGAIGAMMAVTRPPPPPSPPPVPTDCRDGGWMGVASWPGGGGRVPRRRDRGKAGGHRPRGQRVHTGRRPPTTHRRRGPMDPHRRRGGPPPPPPHPRRRRQPAPVGRYGSPRPVSILIGLCPPRTFLFADGAAPGYASLLWSEGEICGIHFCHFQTLGPHSYLLVFPTSFFNPRVTPEIHARRPPNPLPPP